MTSTVNMLNSVIVNKFSGNLSLTGKFWYGIELSANVLYLTNKVFTDVVGEHETVGDLW